MAELAGGVYFDLQITQLVLGGAWALFYFGYSYYIWKVQPKSAHRTRLLLLSAYVVLSIPIDAIDPRGWANVLPQWFSFLLTDSATAAAQLLLISFQLSLASAFGPVRAGRELKRVRLAAFLLGSVCTTLLLVFSTLESLEQERSRVWRGCKFTVLGIWLFLAAIGVASYIRSVLRALKTGENRSGSRRNVTDAKQDKTAIMQRKLHALTCTVYLLCTIGVGAQLFIATEAFTASSQRMERGGLVSLSVVVFPVLKVLESVAVLLFFRPRPDKSRSAAGASPVGSVDSMATGSSTGISMKATRSKPVPIDKTKV
eukprot:PLAT12634.1.p1 GENE.PLAT12634.1~~PLAT12634.1.p1  ORF type:complete len:359 (+),score=34.56 PLAT12634.1:137-1078(+)